MAGRASGPHLARRNQLRRVGVPEQRKLTAQPLARLLDDALAAAKVLRWLRTACRHGRMILRRADASEVVVDPVVVRLEVGVGQRPRRTKAIHLGLAEVVRAHARRDARPEHAAPAHTAIPAPVPAFALRTERLVVLVDEVFGALPAARAGTFERASQLGVAETRVGVVGPARRNRGRLRRTLDRTRG